MREDLEKEYKLYKRTNVIFYLLVGCCMFLIILLTLYLASFNGFLSAISIILGIILFAILIKIGDVWNPLDVWEQSLLKRKREEELKESYSKGNRIIYDNEEVIVINGKFVPIKYLKDEYKSSK